MRLGRADLAGRVAVFAGPSLPPESRPDDPRLVWLHPAAAGDAYVVAQARPRVVVLIDGLFDAWPAIRHKELLDLMAAGIPVVGGASMGALRAAELGSFGMIGVGRIFTAYAEGRLTGDDEVAVLHGPGALDWAVLTEALVNVRATLQRAVRERVVTADVARTTLQVARSVFYKDRTWAGLVDALAGRPALAGQARALEAWLPRGRVNLKQADARACVSVALTLGDAAAAPIAPPPRSPFAEALAAQVAGGLTDPERPFAPRPGTAPPPHRT
jgi:hypothetical protein